MSNKEQGILNDKIIADVPICRCADEGDNWYVVFCCNECIY